MTTNAPLCVTVLTSDEFDTLMRQLRNPKTERAAREAAKRGAKMLAEFERKGHVTVKASSK